MRTVVATDAGVIELNWTWLPTFIGMDAAVRREMQQQIATEFEGKALTEETLYAAHKAVVAFLCQRYPAIQGLERYLDALKFVEIKE